MEGLRKAHLRPDTHECNLPCKPDKGHERARQSAYKWLVSFLEALPSERAQRYAPSTLATMLELLDQVHLFNCFSTAAHVAITMMLIAFKRPLALGHISVDKSSADTAAYLVRPVRVFGKCFHAIVDWACA